MISLHDYDSTLKTIAGQYLIGTMEYVKDIREWSRNKGIDLSEPDQPMKLVPADQTLSMVIQSHITDDVLENIIRALTVRWSTIDNVSDPGKRLNSVKKRLAYCFLKEYARTIRDLQGDELKEDQWALNAVERLGFFRE